jgi:hypothetical protein
LFPLFATSVIDTGDKFAAGVVDIPVANCCWLPQVSLTSVANLPPVTTTLAKLVAKFAAGVVRGRVDGAGEPIRTKGQTVRILVLWL